MSEVPSIDDAVNLMGVNGFVDRTDITSEVDVDDIVKRYINQNPNSISTSNRFKNELNQIQNMVMNDTSYKTPSIKSERRSVKINTSNTPFTNSLNYPSLSPPLSPIIESKKYASEFDQLDDDIISNSSYKTTNIDKLREYQNRNINNFEIGNRNINNFDTNRTDYKNTSRHSDALNNMLDYNIKNPQLVNNDDRIGLLEDINAIREALEDDRVIVSDIPVASENMGMSELDQIHQRLKSKMRRLRATSTAEELLVLLAKAVELIFNGENDYLGYRLNATGWSSTVKAKTRRMRFDMSRLVSSFTEGRGMSSGANILLELVPSLALHMAKKKSEQETPLPSSDETWKDNLNKMNALDD
jgi:hypothetical protein